MESASSKWLVSDRCLDQKPSKLLKIPKLVDGKSNSRYRYGELYMQREDLNNIKSPDMRSRTILTNIISLELV